MEVSNSQKRISEMLGDIKPNDYTFDAVFKFLQCIKPYLRHIHIFQDLKHLYAFKDEEGNECVSDSAIEGGDSHAKALANYDYLIKIKQLAAGDGVVSGGPKGDLLYKTREYDFIILLQNEATILMRWEVCYRFTVPISCSPELTPVRKTYHPIRSIFSFLDPNKLKAIAEMKEGEAKLAKDIFAGLEKMIFEDIESKEQKILNIKAFGQWLEKFMKPVKVNFIPY